jgi:hypothetical protein
MINWSYLGEFIIIIIIFNVHQAVVKEKKFMIFFFHFLTLH